MSPAAQDGLPPARRKWAALAIWLSLVAVSLELMAVNVALPTIVADFGVTPADATWAIKAYQMGVLLTLLPMSALGEKFGYRNVSRFGLITFSIAAFGSMQAGGLWELACWRALAGIGISGIVSVNGALARHSFPRDRLGRALGINSLIVAFFSGVGPSFASILIAFASWRWLFAATAPICLVALVAGWKALPESQLSDRPFDRASALLYAICIGAVFAGVELAGTRIISLPVAIAAGVSIVAGVTLYRRSLATPKPLVPVDLLRSQLFRLSVLTAIAATAAQALSFIALPFHFSNGMQRPAIEIGPLMMAWPIAVAIAAPMAGRLADQVSTALLAGIGLAVLSAGLFLMTSLPDDAPSLQVILYMAVCGFGFGFFQSPNNHLILTSAPLERAGAAAGMQAIARHIGQIGGAIVAGLAFTLAPGRELLAVGIAGAVAAFAAVLSLARLPMREASRELS